MYKQMGRVAKVAKSSPLWAPLWGPLCAPKQPKAGPPRHCVSAGCIELSVGVKPRRPSWPLWRPTAPKGTGGRPRLGAAEHIDLIWQLAFSFSAAAHLARAALGPSADKGPLSTEREKGEKSPPPPFYNNNQSAPARPVRTSGRPAPLSAGLRAALCSTACACPRSPALLQMGGRVSARRTLKVALKVQPGHRLGPVYEFILGRHADRPQEEIINSFVLDSPH